MRPVKSSCAIAVSILFVFIGLDVEAVRADTYYVDDDAPNDPGPNDPTISDPLEDGSAEHPFDAIQEAIDAAMDNDEVVVRDGRYTGPGNRDLDFGGRAITVRSASGDPALCIIACEGSSDDPHRGFHFHSGEDADSILEGFTITNGWTGGSGGGIRCVDCSLTIQECTLIGNTAENRGGGLFAAGTPSLTISMCTFSGNTAFGGGGIGCVDTYGTITNCILWDNVAPIGSQLSLSWSSATVAHCNLQGGQEAVQVEYESTLTWVDGNIDADSRLTQQGRLSIGSPCIDAGDEAALPSDTADLDGDGDTTESLPVDVDGDPRVAWCAVDMGAYEHQGPFGDFDEDCAVTLNDYELFEVCLWFSGPDEVPPFAECLDVFDFDLDADVDLHDFAAFQLARNDPTGL